MHAVSVFFHGRSQQHWSLRPASTDSTNALGPVRSRPFGGPHGFPYLPAWSILCFLPLSRPPALSSPRSAQLHFIVPLLAYVTSAAEAVRFVNPAASSSGDPTIPSPTTHSPPCDYMSRHPAYSQAYGLSSGGEGACHCESPTSATYHEPKTPPKQLQYIFSLVSRPLLASLDPP